jgi:ribosomal 50S subunit-associated protein YjgA (DUF615 family)
MEVFIMPAVWKAIKAIRLAKAGLTRNELGRALLVLDELQAVYDLVRMKLADEAAQAWQQEVGGRIKFIIGESMKDEVDIEAIREEVQEIRGIALKWQDLLNQGGVMVQRGYEGKVKEYLSRVVKQCEIFLNMTEGWTTVVLKEPEKVVQENLAGIGKLLESMPVRERSRALEEVKAAFEGLRAAIEAKDKGEIVRKVEEFKEAWGSFVEEMGQYNWFGSVGAMKAAAQIEGELIPGLLSALSDLGLWGIYGERAEARLGSSLQKQFLEEERQWIRKRALDKVRSAKDFLQWLNEGLLEDIIHNKLRDMVSGIETDLSDLRDNIERARELLVHLELHMEREKPDVEMVDELCGRLKELLGPLQGRLRSVLEEAERQVEEVRKRTNLPFLGKEGLVSIATILHVLEGVVNETPNYARELRKPIRKPRPPKVKPRFGWLP